MNEQYEMVTWLISWFVAPYAFPFLFYEQFIFIIFWRSYVYTCKGTMIMLSYFWHTNTKVGVIIT